MNKIYIKPVPRTSPFGITTKSSDTIRTFDRDGREVQLAAVKDRIKRHGAKQTRLCLPISNQTGRFIVFPEGLVENPYYKNKESIPSNWIEKSDYLRKTEKISYQQYYELKHDVEQGKYTTNRTDISNSKIKVSPTYFETLSREFYDGITVLDLSIPEDEIWYLAIKESAKNITSKFATSLEDSYEKPKALFYIADEAKEDAAEVNQYDMFDTAVANFTAIKNKLSATQRYQFAVVLQLVNTHAITDEKVTKMIREYVYKTQNVETSSQRLASKENLEKFHKYFNMLSNANTLVEFNLLYLIQEGLNQEVLRKRDNEYIWVPSGRDNGVESLGRWETLVKTLKDPKNFDILTELKDQIKARGVNFE